MRVAQRFVDVAELGRRQPQRDPGLQRAPVQLRGIGMGVARAGVLGGRKPVAPRALVILGAQEVQGEDVSPLAGVLLALDELSRAGVQRAPALVGQRLVRRLALEDVAEADDAGLDLEKRVQPGERHP